AAWLGRTLQPALPQVNSLLGERFGVAKVFTPRGRWKRLTLDPTTRHPAAPAVDEEENRHVTVRRASDAAGAGGEVRRQRTDAAREGRARARTAGPADKSDAG